MMRYTKVLLLAICAVSLALGAAYAGMNPANFGLPTVTVYKNQMQGAVGSANISDNYVMNAMSSMCISCHTRAPINNAAASHFVTGGRTDAADNTHSGGGWSGTGSNGVREAGQYFKVSKWTGAGEAQIAGKFGDIGNKRSVSVNAGTDNAGIATTDATLGNYADKELICESCHNIIKNVAGPNNLLATVVQDNAVAALCVGCHGFLYTTNAANAADTYYADARNTNEVGSGAKGNNHLKVENSAPYNHHVMTGDQISAAKQNADLLWGPQYISATRTTSTTTNTTKDMGMLAAWTDGKVKPASSANNINCFNCHAVHNGAAGASILRDTNVSNDNAATPITRISDTGRKTWGGGNNPLFCNDCHYRVTPGN